MTITTSPGGAIVATGQGIHLYGLLSLRAAMRLYQRAGLTTRAHGTKSQMLRTASAQTGKTYAPRASSSLQDAIADLTTVIEAQEPGQP